MATVTAPSESLETKKENGALAVSEACLDGACSMQGAFGDAAEKQATLGDKVELPPVEDIPVFNGSAVSNCALADSKNSASEKLESVPAKQAGLFSFPPTPDLSPAKGPDSSIKPDIKHQPPAQESPITITFSKKEGTLSIQSAVGLNQAEGISVDQVLQLISGAQPLQTTASNSAAKPTVKSLKFPPCAVCGGKASGLHYGINSCEACKGFFRRYLLRNEEYKCSKGGNCEIINRNRGNCSGCRLRKCLELGMAKEKSRLGRYTLARRTQTIKEVNKLEGKEEADTVAEGNGQYFVQGGDDGDNSQPGSQYSNSQTTHQHYDDSANGFDPNKEMISRKLHSQEEFVPKTVPFSDTLIDTLVTAMDEIKPFGLAITTQEHLQKALRNQYDKYNLKIKMYGQMKSVPREEFKRLYKDYGIDVDGRMNVLRKSAKEVEGMIERYCMFAKHIPDFRKLTCRDQSNLLKASRCDFFVILMSEGYSEEYQVFISHSGCAYHIEEAADKFFTRKLITTVCDMYRRWQLLDLSKPEKALLIALTLVFTDRCNLDNHAQVEKIQLSLAELLRNQLEKTCKASARKRFAKIISHLTLMRESSELYLKEYKELCNDEMVVEEVPMMTEFLLEDW